MSETDDIESEIVRILDGGRMTLDELMRRLAWVDDRRWIGVGIDLHLVKDGRIRYTDCDTSHNHIGTCTVEAVR